VEVLCEGPSKTNRARLMGRTRTNKIVVFEGNEKLIGEIVHVEVQQANGFSLYGTPVRVGHASSLPSSERKPEACATLAATF
jgi:tRNA A37 methylthiotransferase MiaB